MASDRSATEAPVLQLTVLQGPRTGEILLCNPENSAATNVGRVMRGNHLALRDPGISQKHLSFRFSPEEFRWCVSDLGTSNGTLLNGSPIAAAALSDGDVVEIGERTRIGVKIVARSSGGDEEEEADVRGRRVTRRGGSSRGSSVRVSARGRRNNAAMAAIEENEVLNPDLVSDSVVEANRRGTGRGRKDAVTATDARVSEELDQNGGEVKVGRSSRRGKSARVLKELDVNCAVRVLKGRGRGKNTAVPPISDPEKENNASSSSVILKEEAEEVKENSEEEELKVDFEKMTLEEWFESMEVFLPKAVREESERLIGVLKEKSIKFAEMVVP